MNTEFGLKNMGVNMKESVVFDDIKTVIEEYVNAYPGATGDKNIWRTPLAATARADKRFDILPEIAADDHALPRDLLATGKSVIVFFVPFVEELAKGLEE